jgi:sugar lactone lactonase YvrE
MRKSILSVLSCLVPLCAASSAFAAAPSLLMPNYGTSVLNYDVSTGAFLGVFASGGGLTSANGLGFGPSGDLYVVDSSTSNVLRYDGGTGAFVGVFSNATNCWYQPTFGPDGNLYVGCSGGTIQRFNGTTGASLGVFVPAPSGSVDFGGMAFFNGSLFVTYVGIGTLVQYNATTGALVATLYSGFSGNGPRTPVFGPDGSMYVPEWQTHNVKKFAASTYAFLGNFISDAGLTPYSVAFAPDGTLLALNDPCCSGPDTVRRYDSTTGAFLSVLVTAGSGGLSRAPQMLRAPVVATPTPALGGLAPLLGIGLAALALLALRSRSPAA